MENRDRLINDLAIQYMQLKLENMQMNYEIESLKKIIEELQKKEGNE